METTGASYEDALAEATRLGYAEADPTADVEGHDAASKAAILASLGFYTRLTFNDVYCEGISKITADDIKAANQAGYSIKLLAICERLVDEETGEESVNARRGALAGDTDARAQILHYNAGDVRATHAVREWMSHGAPGVPSLEP